jgi:cyclopropane fatty-acyl-phospholipid synthase-like methyltransferase
MKLTDFEEEIKGYYEKIWSDPSKIKRTGQGVFLGWHYGFYEKGIKNISDAMLNMNNYVDRLLTLNKSSSKDILDCGSGIGHTSIFLAEKYPKCSFYGITLTKYELEIAEKLKKESCVGNLLFHVSSVKTTIPP